MSPTPGPRSARTPYRNSSPVKPSSTSARKLGRIGGAKRADPQPATITSREETRTRRDGSASSETAPNASRKLSFADSASESPLKSRESTSTNGASTASEAKKPQKIFGRIGGKRKTPTPPPAEEPPHSSVTPDPANNVEITPPASQSRPRHQLGRLGGPRRDSILTAPAMTQERPQHEDDSMETTTEDHMTQAVEAVPTTTRTPTPQAEPIEESQEERATRHRAELKREASMVKKPAPKRRKF